MLDYSIFHFRWGSPSLRGPVCPWGIWCMWVVYVGAVSQVYPLYGILKFKWGVYIHLNAHTYTPTQDIHYIPWGASGTGTGREPLGN